MSKRRKQDRPPDRNKPDRLDVALHWAIRSNWGARRLLVRAATHAADAEGFTRGELSLVVVGRRRMAALHEQHLGIAGPTDVLTFDLGTDASERLLTGEIIVCADVARMNAARASLAAARAELALYVVHGVLHLAGYDDKSPDEFARMHRREDRLLRDLGLGPVFSRR